MGIRLMERQSVKQPGELVALYGDNFFRCLRPLEAVLFQSFNPEAIACAVPVQYFDNISLPVAKTEKMPGQWVKIKLLLHQNGEAVNGLAHVGHTGGKVNLDR